MTLTVRLESATENALASFCSSQAMTKSQVVHQALSSWLKAQPASSGNALLAFVPQVAQAKKKVATVSAPYESYSKATLRCKVLSKASGKKP
jgi:hypothetical protein